MWNCINWDVSLQQKHTGGILKKELWQAKWGSKVSGPSRGRDSNRTKSRSGCISLFWKGQFEAREASFLKKEQRRLNQPKQWLTFDNILYVISSCWSFSSFVKPVCQTLVVPKDEFNEFWICITIKRFLFCERLQRLPTTNQVIWLDNQKVSKDSSILSRDVFIQK